MCETGIKAIEIGYNGYLFRSRFGSEVGSVL